MSGNCELINLPVWGLITEEHPRPLTLCRGKPYHHEWVYTIVNTVKKIKKYLLYTIIIRLTNQLTVLDMTCIGAWPLSCTPTYFPAPTPPLRLDHPSVAFTMTTCDDLNWSTTAGFVVGKGISVPRNRRCVSVRPLLVLSWVSSRPSCNRKSPRIRASCNLRHLQRGVLWTMVHDRVTLTTRWHGDH